MRNRKSRFARIVVLTVALTLVPGGAMAVDRDSVEVRELRTNSLSEPLSVSGRAPLFSWQLDSDRRGVRQSRYEVRVASPPPESLGQRRGESGQSVDVAVRRSGAEAVHPVTWTVRVTDERGRRSDWSRPATFETGPLSAQDWTPSGSAPTPRSARSGPTTPSTSTSR